MNWNERFSERTGVMRRTAIRELLRVTGQPGMISFAGGLPAADLFPVAAVKQAASDVLDRCGGLALQYGETEGIPGLRDWIAARFSREGHPVRRENVVVTTGAQQALDLLGRVLLDPGDKVLVENPTYLALLSAWRPLGVEFLPVPSDFDGLRMEAMERLLERRPKLIYSMPNFQNPQGTTLSAQKRAKLVSLLETHDCALVEDDPYGELRYTGEPVPSLFSLAARRSGSGRLESRVIYAGTFSKVLMPGLRVGWVIAPEELVDKLVQIKQGADLHTSTFCQHVALELLNQGVRDRFLPQLIENYRLRRDQMLAGLEKHFPAGCAWTRPEGGMFLLVTLPESLDAAALLPAALERKVAFVPGEEFHLGGEGRNTLRLNFSNAKPEEIEVGMERLGGIFDF